MYALYVTFNTNIGGVPLTHATGSTTDISPILRFHWWQPVYYHLDDSSFPSESRKLQGRFVSIMENVGDAMTFKILMDETYKIISRSNVCPTDDSLESNMCLDSLGGEKKKVY